MDHRQQQEEENLEEYSVEAPAPPAFLPCDQNSAALSYDEPTTTGNNNGGVDLAANDDGYGIRHGRSPRFYLLLAAVLLVVTAVGAGVGVALSGKDDGDRSTVNQAITASDSNNNDGSLTPSTTQQQQDSNNGQPVRDDKIDGAPGDVVEFGNSGTYGVPPETTTTTTTAATTATTSEVMDILMAHARYHGVEFQDANSYQSRAARWVEETAQVGVHSPERLVQRYALACVYFASNGVRSFYTDEIFGVGTEPRGWIDESGWIVDADECGWYRISCNADGFVTKIELHQNRLTGQFPPEVALLKDSLEVVDLYQNPIYNKGAQNNDWLGELTNLQKLFFGHTYFQYDGIPAAIGKLTNLVEFDCSYSLYHGPLRGESFAQLSNLEYLHIGGNRYNSSIPYELAQLPSLQFLYGEFSDLTGDINFVKWMQDTPIVEMWLDKNPMLGGTIPTELGLVTTLRSFSITGCDFEGSIPTELGNLRLQQSWFYGNDKLVGSMPPEVCATRYPDGKLMILEATCTDTFTCDCCSVCNNQETRN